MTIDTARCETCGHTKFDHAGPDWSNAQGCCEDGCKCRKFVGPDCTEPAPSAGVKPSSDDLQIWAAAYARSADIWRKHPDEESQRHAQQALVHEATFRELLTARSRIAELSDQLQASQCAEKMTADLLVDAKARIAELEAGIRKWASECGECDGKGFIRAVVTIHRDGHVDRPCEACADIRALLPKESDNG